MDALAGIATVAQLCEYIAQGVVKVKDTLDQFDDLPPVLQDHTRSLDDLSAAIQSIGKNKTLQTQEILNLLRSINSHVESLQVLLRDSLNRVRQKSLKSFKHLFRKGEKDNEVIEKALDGIERDKNTLSLFMLNNFGLNLAQLNDMSAKKVQIDPPEQSKDGQFSKQAYQNVSGTVSSSEGSAITDKREWSENPVSGMGTEAIFGDRPKNYPAPRMIVKQDERKWHNNPVSDGAHAVFGD